MKRGIEREHRRMLRRRQRRRALLGSPLVLGLLALLLLALAVLYTLAQIRTMR